jgi:hypothetical protein
MGQTLCLGYAPLSTSGEMFSSLYRLFQAVRAESTVALSGESSDEIFGGYPWFHDPMAIDAATFPWLSTTGNTLDGTQVPDPDLLERLNLPEFQARQLRSGDRRDPGPPGRGRRRVPDARNTCYESYRTLRDGSMGWRCPRHFVPGYDHAVPLGQNTFCPSRL